MVHLQVHIYLDHHNVEDPDPRTWVDPHIFRDLVDPLWDQVDHQAEVFGDLLGLSAAGLVDPLGHVVEGVHHGDLGPSVVYHVTPVAVVDLSIQNQKGYIKIKPH